MLVRFFLKASIEVNSTSDSFAATQYASVFFSHDHASVISDNGTIFSKAVVEQCLSNPVQYLPPSECENYGGIGYVIGYNFTALHVTVSPVR
jgi:hypothetical protein